MMPNIHSSKIVFAYNENKHDQLTTRLYCKREKDIQTICHENLVKEHYNLRKPFDEELRSRICKSLKYDNLCVHPNFNTFNGKGNHVAHLKDYCSRLVGIGHVEAI
ncbi:hypothetical protein R3W88_032992 [Solanum pinnatisectum]|uniref:Uncharacterized protein n=1 Tax=Solanum pinnatisectum TaxID=50273 RepID=A0AAV9K424_9SOLN|nr:hypothetical protein R3W88_032992 [Solanum pinnatisectum]